MNHGDVRQVAIASVRGLRLQPADRDDAEQEAALGMLRKLGNLDPARSEDEQRGYLWKVGRSRALNYLAWRTRTSSREFVFAGDPDGPEADPLELAQVASPLGSRASSPTPEEMVANIPTLALGLAALARSAAWGDEEHARRAAIALELGYARLSSQQAALLRHKLGVEDMRADLVKLGSNSRGSVANAVRAKLLAAAREMGASDLVTVELLYAMFSHRRD